MVSSKLSELGIVLPEVTPPFASYVPARKEGSLVYISGQLPLKDGELLMTGLMSKERNLAEAQAAMERCFINGLAAAVSLTESPDALSGVLRLGAFVASESNYFDQHLVANGASNLAEKIFGESGRHVRAAVGVSALPLNATVELEIIFLTATG